MMSSLNDKFKLKINVLEKRIGELQRVVKN